MGVVVAIAGGPVSTYPGFADVVNWVLTLLIEVLIAVDNLLYCVLGPAGEPANTGAAATNNMIAAKTITFFIFLLLFDV